MLFGGIYVLLLLFQYVWFISLGLYECLRVHNIGCHKFLINGIHLQAIGDIVAFHRQGPIYEKHGAILDCWFLRLEPAGHALGTGQGIAIRQDFKPKEA